MLMCKNAMTYNTPDTIYHQAAKKYLALGLKIIIKVRGYWFVYGLGVR